MNYVHVTTADNRVIAVPANVKVADWIMRWDDTGEWLTANYSAFILLIPNSFIVR